MRAGLICLGVKVQVGTVGFVGQSSKVVKLRLTHQLNMSWVGGVWTAKQPPTLSFGKKNGDHIHKVRTSVAEPFLFLCTMLVFNLSSEKDDVDRKT